jgi:hypothetical protein
MSVKCDSVWRRQEIEKRIWVVAKGPSCNKIERYIRSDDHVASINDGASHILRDRIEFAFFSDWNAIQSFESFHKKVCKFVAREPSDRDADKTPLWIQKKLELYRWRECGGSRRELTKRILEGGICHHHTTPAAIHWLAKFSDYTEICVIGVDGGKRYASGKKSTCPLLTVDLYHWRIISERTADICSRVYGKRIMFFREDNHSSES